jgi:hypothetical protein
VGRTARVLAHENLWHNTPNFMASCSSARFC